MLIYQFLFNKIFKHLILTFEIKKKEYFTIREKECVVKRCPNICMRLKKDLFWVVLDQKKNKTKTMKQV